MTDIAINQDHYDALTEADRNELGQILRESGLVGPEGYHLHGSPDIPKAKMHDDVLEMQKDGLSPFMLARKRNPIIGFGCTAFCQAAAAFAKSLVTTQEPKRTMFFAAIDQAKEMCKSGCR